MKPILLTEHTPAQHYPVFNGDNVPTTVPAFAQAAGITRQHAHALVRDGAIRAWRLRNGMFLLGSADVAAYVAARDESRVGSR